MRDSNSKYRLNPEVLKLSRTKYPTFRVKDIWHFVYVDALPDEITFHSLLLKKKF